jgi:TolB-like protein
MSFFGELKRRKVFQVAAVYAVVSWLLVQIVATIEHPLRLPDWFDTAIVVLLATGFPITLIISWAFDVTSEGLVRDRGGVSVHRRGHGIEIVLTGLLIGASAWIGYRELGIFFSPNDTSDARISIAVLPLSNISGDPEQEPISDGMTDEISYALSRLDGLNLVGRTSVFQFKNEARDLRDIGRALGATHLLEGSVQVSGTQVRITLSLIRADSGVEVWADRFF